MDGLFVLYIDMLIRQRGRLDSTNVITPLVSVITSIDMDHTEFLGNTREAICAEKAGIIKPKIPVVMGPHVPVQVVEEFCQRQQAPLTRINQEFSNYEDENRAVVKGYFFNLFKYFNCTFYLRYN